MGIGQHEGRANLGGELRDDGLHVATELVGTKMRFGGRERAGQGDVGGDHQRAAAFEMLKPEPRGDRQHPGGQFGGPSGIEATDRRRDPQHGFLREVLDGLGMAGGSKQPREQREYGPRVVVDQLAQRDSVTALCISQVLYIELGPAVAALGVGSHRPLTSRTLARVPAGTEKNGGDASRVDAAIAGQGSLAATLLVSGQV